jgi:hypothetical protein
MLRRVTSPALRLKPNLLPWGGKALSRLRRRCGVHVRLRNTVRLVWRRTSCRSIGILMEGSKPLTVGRYYCCGGTVAKCFNQPGINEGRLLTANETIAMSSAAR